MENNSRRIFETHMIMNYGRYLHSPFAVWLKWRFKRSSEIVQKRYFSCSNFYSKSQEYLSCNDWQSLEENPVPSVIKSGRIIGIKYWREGVFSLNRKRIYFDYYPLLLKDGNLFHIKKNALFRSVDGKVSKIIEGVETVGPYNEMISKYGCFALRTGGVIRVSTDVDHWEVIYDGKRGIKNSMVLLQKNGHIVLVFIEYSTRFEAYNHRVLEYDYSTKQIKTLKTFANRTTTEYNPEIDFARHIHVIQEDPYTGDVYLGTGDFDFEPGIYVSHDKCETFDCIGKGDPMYRSLSFIFTEKSVFWNTDTPEYQFIYRMNKEDRHIDRFPLINSALWCTMQYKISENQIMYVMSSNSEGAWFDNCNRVYGIMIRDDIPTIYELYKKSSKGKYEQLFPCCVCKNKLYFYNTLYRWVEERTLENRKQKLNIEI